jgi:hypothetical protein
LREQNYGKNSKKYAEALCDAWKCGYYDQSISAEAYNYNKEYFEILANNSDFLQKSKVKMAEILTSSG